jgi:hypothetical protein
VFKIPVQGGGHSLAVPGFHEITERVEIIPVLEVIVVYGAK